MSFRLHPQPFSPPGPMSDEEFARRLQAELNGQPLPASKPPPSKPKPAAASQEATGEWQSVGKGGKHTKTAEEEAAAAAAAKTSKEGEASSQEAAEHNGDNKKKSGGEADACLRLALTSYLHPLHACCLLNRQCLKPAFSSRRIGENGLTLMIPMCALSTSQLWRLSFKVREQLVTRPTRLSTLFIHRFDFCALMRFSPCHRPRKRLHVNVP